MVYGRVKLYTNLIYRKEGFMKILVIGSGGREHAIIKKLSESPRVQKLYCAPGNGGISALAECIPIKATDKNGMIELCKEKTIDMVFVAPDDPLAEGMVDSLSANGIAAFGPVAAAAEIEGSKVFSKQLMKKYNIPTADYIIIDNPADAYRYLDKASLPLAIKADGLAKGKGVILAHDLQTARNAIREIMEDKVFGNSGSRIVIEQFINGPEVSVLVFTDGKTVLPMVSSQDHKRIFDNDKGPNTGGMGAFSPSRHYTGEMSVFCLENILRPTVEAMNKEGRRFRGVLYCGLMLTNDGPKVLEYNARFGDPETQVVLPRLKTDLVDIMEAILENRLHEIKTEWKEEACACVVLSSGGYPGEFKTGFRIYGIEEASKLEGVFVYHSGTRLDEEGNIVTAGGRVLCVSALGATHELAVENAYRAAGMISFEGMHYRRDIGRELKELNKWHLTVIQGSKHDKL